MIGYCLREVITPLVFWCLIFTHFVSDHNQYFTDDYILTHGIYFIPYIHILQRD